jgi:hypothetical protein
MLTNNKNFDDSPQPINTHRTNTSIKNVEEIYNENYWQSKVDCLMKEKKNILEKTKQSHQEIRKITNENT